MAVTASRTEKLTRKRLEELSQDSRNLVYEYRADADARPTLSADDARDTVCAIRARYLELRRQHENWTDDRVRERLCVERREWRTFAASCKMLFSKTTESTTGDKEMKHLYYILYMNKQRETGALSAEECNAQVQQYMLKQFLTDKKAEEGTYAPIQS